MNLVDIIRIFFPNFSFLEDINKIIITLSIIFWLINLLIFIVPFKKGGMKFKIIWGLIFILYLSVFTQDIGKVEQIDIDRMVRDNQKPNILHLMSFNLRDSRIDKFKNQWVQRFEPIVNTIQQTLPDVFGTQEAEKIMLEDLFERSILKDLQYKYFGEATINTTHDSVIGYNSKTVENLENGTFWLSNTPNEEESKLPESALTRSCSWGKFKFLHNNEQFYVFNLHLDHISEKARQIQAQVVIDQSNKIIEDFKGPIFVMGDFNSFPNTASPTKFEENGFQDIRNIDVSKNHSPGQVFSFHAYIGLDIENWYFRIPFKVIATILSSLPVIKENVPSVPFPTTFLMDFIFQKGDMSNLQMRRNYILNNHHNGQYQSDHYPHNVYYEYLEK